MPQHVSTPARLLPPRVLTNACDRWNRRGAGRECRDRVLPWVESYQKSEVGIEGLVDELVQVLENRRVTHRQRRAGFHRGFVKRLVRAKSNYRNVRGGTISAQGANAVAD